MIRCLGRILRRVQAALGRQSMVLRDAPVMIGLSLLRLRAISPLSSGRLGT